MIYTDGNATDRAHERFRNHNDLNNALKELEEASEQYCRAYKGQIATLPDNKLFEAFKKYVNIQNKVAALHHWAEIHQTRNQKTGAQIAEIVREEALVRSRPIDFMISEVLDLPTERAKNLLANKTFAEFHPIIRRFQVPAYGKLPSVDQTIWNRGALEIIDACNAGNEHDDMYAKKMREMACNAILPAQLYGYSSPDDYILSKEFIATEEIFALKSAITDRKKLFTQFNNIAIFLANAGIHPLNDLNEIQGIAWETAKKLLTRAYKDFNPELGEIIKASFKNGTFCLTPPHYNQGITIQACRVFSPEIFLSYTNNLASFRDAAHEFGHYAQAFMRNKNGHAQAMQSVFVDETSAIFGERVLWEYIKPKTTGTGISLIDTAEQIGSVIRFSMINDFQIEATKLCANGKCAPQSLDRIWHEIAESYLGNSPEKGIAALNWREDSGKILEKPFSAIAYAYGQLVSHQMWKMRKRSPREFGNHYISFLKQSSGKKAHELLLIMGIDTKKKNFWTSAIDSLFNDYSNAVRSAIQPNGYSRQKMLQRIMDI